MVKWIKNDANETAAPATTHWKLPLIYQKDLVDSFWSETDEDTRKLVFPEYTYCMLTMSYNSAISLSAQPRNANEFRQKIRKSLTGDETKYLTNCSASELEILFSRYLDQVENAKKHHEGDGRGWKAARNGVSKFLNNFNDYVRAYSGVIQIMNGAGPSYGDAAYGALSVLLVVLHPDSTSRLLRA